MGDRERAADHGSGGQGHAASSELTLNVVPDLDGGVTVRLAGDVAGAHLGDLERRLRVLGSRGHLAVRLDLGHVRGIDAAAFGRLAGLQVDLLQRGGTVTLVNVTPAVRRVIDASGRAGVFLIEA